MVVVLLLLLLLLLLLPRVSVYSPLLVTASHRRPAGITAAPTLTVTGATGAAAPAPAAGVDDFAAAAGA